MSNLVYLSDVILSFPTLVEPKVEEVMDEKTGTLIRKSSYRASFLMKPDSEAYRNFKKAVSEVALAKFADKCQAALNRINADRKSRCFGDGEEAISPKTLEVYNGYKGMVYIQTRRPEEYGVVQVFNEDGNKVDSNNSMLYKAECRRFYAGCRVNASVEPWAQMNKHGFAIRCSLVGIQFLADGEALARGEQDVSGLFGATKPKSENYNPFAFS